MKEWNIYNNDCLEGMKQLPDESIDLVVTSPPYDNLRLYNGFKFDFKGIARELYRVMQNGGVIVWIVSDGVEKGSETGTSFKQALYFKEIGFRLHDTMIWRKDCSAFPDKTRYFQCFEYMFILSKGQPKTVNLIKDRKNLWGGTKVHGTYRQADGTMKRRSKEWQETVYEEYGYRYNVWDIPTEKNNKTGHPAVFPSKLVKDHITTWSNPGDTVMDIFSGSGTTAIEALNSGRKFVGFEISKEYYDKSVERIKNETSQMNIFEFL